MPAPLQNDARGAMVRALREVAREQKLAPPEPDDRLNRLAEALAEVVPRTGAFPYAAVAFGLSYFGIAEPTPAMQTLWSGRARPEDLAETVRQQAPALLQSAAPTHVGVGLATRPEGTAAVMLLLSSQLKLKPVARQLKLGQQTSLVARIDRSHREATLWITPPEGAVVRVAEQRGRRLKGRLACGSTRGRYQVEVLAENDRGPVVLANFPVWCGIAPPRQLTVKPSVAVADSNAAAEQATLRWVNRARAKARLPSLKWHEALAEVARNHTEEMVRTGVMAHTSPTTGTAADRVQAAGIATPLVQENLARSETVAEAHRGLMNSPSHRANILAPDATHLGVGAVVQEATQGERDVFITQLFIRVPPTVDPAATQARIIDRLGAQHGIDPTLQSAAQAQANALARGETPEELRAASQQALNASRFGQLKTLVLSLDRVEAFDPQVVPSRSDGSRLGVGVAQGPHPTLGPNTIYVVLLLAQPPPTPESRGDGRSGARGR